MPSTDSCLLLDPCVVLYGEVLETSEKKTGMVGRSLITEDVTLNVPVAISPFLTLCYCLTVVKFFFPPHNASKMMFCPRM